MITQAKIKNVMVDFSGISAAYHGYQDCYRAIPGDDPNAAARWGGPAVSGDGNGVVAGLYSAACPDPLGALGADEQCKFWDHLRRAGFVAGTGGNQPFNALTGMIGVQTGNGAGGPALTDPGPPAAGPGFVGLIMCSANLPDKIAIAVDTQMDDGLAGKGTVRGQLQAGPNPPIAGAAVATYGETGANIYTICRAL